MRRADERGTVTVFVVGFMFALLLMAGLVFDGGTVLASRREAANVAEAAARAGAQAVDVGSARRVDGARIDAPAAKARAMKYLMQTGYDGSVSVEEDVVLVEVTITRRAFLLGLGGLKDITVHGRGRARDARGVDREDR